MSVPHVIPGVYIRLKSITTPLKVKLKLVKYSWISESVIIPNKTEVLLDFIVGLLLKKKSLSEDDITAIWHCLEWLLLTKKMQQTLSKQHLNLKPSFSWVFISSLSDVSQGKLSYSDCVMTCCNLLLSSSALSYIFTSNIDNMTNLLSAVCSMSLHQLSAVGCMEQNTSDMLCLLIKAFSEHQKNSCNQMQVLKFFYRKLFRLMLVLLYKCENVPQHQHISCLLADTMRNTIFNMEKRLAFKKMKKLSVASEFFDSHSGFFQLFTIMRKAIEATGSTTNAITTTPNINTTFEVPCADLKSAVLDYLPKLLVSVIEDKTEKSMAVQIMLDRISKLLGFDLKEGKFHGSVEESKAIEVMAQLLDRINSMNLYGLGDDDDDDDDGGDGEYESKFWFMYSKQLPQILFTAESKGMSWIRCMKSLLFLNPSLSVDYLQEILCVCWSVLTRPEECDPEEVDSLLESILEVYHRMRQMPFLMGKLVASVAASSLQYNYKWPPCFAAKFQTIVQSLPPTVALQVWELLLDAIEKELAPNLKENSGEDSITTVSSQKQPVCSCIIGLLLNYMGHLVIVGPSLTANNTVVIQKLQNRMKVSVIVPSIYLCLRQPTFDPDLLEASLLLIYEWWEMAFILCYYSPPGQGDASLDLSTFSFLTPTIRKKIVQSVGNGSLVCYLLQLQCMKAVQIFPDCESEKKKAKICNLDGIISLLQTNDDDAEESMTNKNKVLHPHIPVRTMKQATWWFVTTNLPLLLPLFTPQHSAIICKFLVQTLMTDPTQRDLSVEAGFSRELLQCSFFQEISSFHSVIISCVFSTLVDSMTDTNSPLPDDMQKVVSVCRTLQNSDLAWDNPSDKEVCKALKGVGKELHSLYEDSVAQSETQQQFLHKYSTVIEIIQLLPVRFLPAKKKVRIILSLYVVIPCCTVFGANVEDHNETLPLKDQNLSLIVRCIDTLSSLISSSSDYVFISDYLQPQVVLHFLENSLGKIQKQKSSDQLTLLVSYYKLLESSLSFFFQGSTQLSALDSYITKLLKSLSKAKDRMHKHSYSKKSIQQKYSFKFLLASKFIEELSKTLEQEALSEETRDSATKYLKMFSDVVPQIVIPCIESEMAPSVLALYTSLLKSLKNVPEGQSNQHSQQLTNCCIANISKKGNLVDSVLSLEFFNQSLRHLLVTRTPELHSSLWCCLKEFLTFLFASFIDSQDGQVLMPSQKHHEECLNTATAFTLLSDFSDLQFNSVTPHQSSTPPPPSSSFSRQRYIESLYSVAMSTMLSLITTMSVKERRSRLNSLVSCLKSSVCLDSMVDIAMNSEILCILFKKDMFVDNIQLHKILLNSSQQLFQQAQHHSNTEKMSKIYIPLLRLELNILKKKKLPPQAALHVLYGCQYVPLSNLDLTTFHTVFQALYDVLNILFVEYTDAVLLKLPTFIGIIKRLVVAVVAEGNQNKLSNNIPAETSVCNCAHLLLRLINNLSVHKSEVSPVVSYMIAEFLDAYSNITLLPSVKNLLNSSLYSLFMCCNHHTIEYLNAILPRRMNEVFKSIYTTYTKTYEYKGFA
ncbi:unhealthy ribosome biogenesis protein 2 homolog [Argonauta hians]